MKENAGNIYLRILDWAGTVAEKCPQGHYFQDVHFGSDEIHSRKLWSLTGLRYAVYAGIQEGFLIEKTNLQAQEKDRQLFISNRPSDQWDSFWHLSSRVDTHGVSAIDA